MLRKKTPTQKSTLGPHPRFEGGNGRFDDKTNPVANYARSLLIQQNLVQDWVLTLQAA